MFSTFFHYPSTCCSLITTSHTLLWALYVDYYTASYKFFSVLRLEHPAMPDAGVCMLCASESCESACCVYTIRVITEAQHDPYDHGPLHSATACDQQSTRHSTIDIRHVSHVHSRCAPSLLLTSRKLRQAGSLDINAIQNRIESRTKIKI